MYAFAFARIASIGALRMDGVAADLDASLEAQCRQMAFDTIVDVFEAPLSVAAGLLVRQHLTGRDLPPAAANVVRHWRGFVQEHAGKDMEALRGCLLDRRRFANLCRGGRLNESFLGRRTCWLSPVGAETGRTTAPLKIAFDLTVA